jgi:hypothetical protein
MEPRQPKLIAFCGHPKAGKTEAQKILEERYGAIPIDDGWPMRDFAIRHLGLTIDDVTTQEGKAQTIIFAGKSFTVRWFLGELGNALEALLGADAIPLMAARHLESDQLYCVASLRRDQARVWKKFGGLIVQIDNPIAKPSPYAFDQFDESYVDIVLANEALAWGHPPAVARQDLTRRLDAIMGEHFGLEPLRIGR